MNFFRVSLISESDSYLIDKLVKDSIRVDLLLTFVDFLHKDQHSAHNHSDIVLVLHLECWTEDDANQNFYYFQDVGASLRLQLIVDLAFRILEQGVTEVLDVDRA